MNKDGLACKKAPPLFSMRLSYYTKIALVEAYLFKRRFEAKPKPAKPVNINKNAEGAGTGTAPKIMSIDVEACKLP